MAKLASIPFNSKQLLFHKPRRDSLFFLNVEKDENWKTDGLKVLQRMKEDPDLHEKIFQMFSKLHQQQYQSQSSECETGSFDGSQNAEHERMIMQRLMYFFGPYAKTATGESLYEASKKQQLAAARKHRL